MQQIAYGNTSDAPPATVQIDWTFSDGNTGSQGTGGALSVTGSTTVEIIATNDAPTLATPLPDKNLTIGTPFNYSVPAGAFKDPDLEMLTYGLSMADGSGLPPWLSFNAATGTLSGTPDPIDIGPLDFRMTATDDAGTSVSDIFRLTVASSSTTHPRPRLKGTSSTERPVAMSSMVLLGTTCSMAWLATTRSMAKPV
nr:putative Ig domain-containing protein [Aromatoleum anaerobium]